MVTKEVVMLVVQKSLTFDDVLLLPAHSTVLPREASLASRFSRHVAVQIPVASSAMDTVTEARLAIALAQEGGIGILHKNLSIARQAARKAVVSSATRPAC
jgi:IMP dehydrogenase